MLNRSGKLKQSEQRNRRNRGRLWPDCLTPVNLVRMLLSYCHPVYFMVKAIPKGYLLPPIFLIFQWPQIRHYRSSSPRHHVDPSLRYLVYSWRFVGDLLFGPVCFSQDNCLELTYPYRFVLRWPLAPFWRVRSPRCFWEGRARILTVFFCCKVSIETGII